jgi:hypothetical protein
VVLLSCVVVIERGCVSVHAAASKVLNSKYISAYRIKLLRDKGTLASKTVRLEILSIINRRGSDLLIRWLNFLDIFFLFYILQTCLRVTLKVRVPFFNTTALSCLPTYIYSVYRQEDFDAN